MKIDAFISAIGADFYTGVPDSQLKALCDYLMLTYRLDPRHHIIAANEGNAVAIAAGYQLATGRTPVVYLQNSGEGNIINPVASLLSRDVYAIPVIFVIGWRGEPGVHDEPQHIFQGKVTHQLLADMDIPAFTVGTETLPEEIGAAMAGFGPLLDAGRAVAFVIRKGALSIDGPTSYYNRYTLTREQAIREVLRFTGEDPVISTTGKASRELFELREAAGQGHQCDFLTVGSMGHSSSVALGVALHCPDQTVWCIDGDGAALMHMGAMAVIGATGPDNLIHIIINNEAHESVGGMPTAASRIDLTAIAAGCGYPVAVCVQNAEQLDRALEQAKAQRCLTMIEVKCAIGSRDDLGRPTTTAAQNRQSFTGHLRRR